AWDDERGIRRLIALLDRAGDRAGAIVAYEDFARRLAEELEVEPAPETRALVEEVRGRAEVSGAAMGAAMRPDVTEAPRLAELASASEPQRPRPRTRARYAGALLAILLLMTGGWWVERRNGAAEPHGSAVPPAPAVPTADVATGPEPDARSVTVAVFENRTGDPELDLLGRLASERIARGLLETGRFRVLTPATLYRVVGRLTETVPAAADSFQVVARATGASTIVYGGYHRSGDSLVMQARIVDVPGARLLHVTEPVRAGLSAPEEGIEILRERVVAALATLRGEDTERWAAAASKPPTFAAFREWIAGLEAHTRGDLEEGLRRLLNAGDLDPTFHQPALWALFSAFDLGRHGVVDSLLARLAAVRDELPPFDEAMLELHLASHDSDFRAYHRAAMELLRLAPDSEFRYKAARGAMALNRPEEALGHLRKANPNHGWLRNWGGYWALLIQALHRLERHTEELEAARDYRAREPGSRAALLFQAPALAALGDLSAVAAVIDELKQAQGPVRLWHMLQIAAELEAHGFARAADQTRRGVVEWYASLPQQRRDDGNERVFAFTLCLIGRTDEGIRRLQAVLTRAPMPGRQRQLLARERVLLSDLGICAALAGHRKAALAYERRLAERTAAAANAPDPHTPGTAAELYLGSRATIFAHLGERDRAMTLLEQPMRLGAATRGPQSALELHLSPKLAPLWGDPAFEELLDRLQAPPHRRLRVAGN
ncbi:MAG: BTAD domain-containing putative transcriptional regulator, partial [Longimicrobiales bacterium]